MRSGLGLGIFLSSCSTFHVHLLMLSDSVKVSLVFVKNNVGKNNDDNEHDSNSKNTDSNYTKLIKYILLKNKKPQFS